MSRKILRNPGLYQALTLDTVFFLSKLILMNGIKRVKKMHLIEKTVENDNEKENI